MSATSLRDGCLLLDELSLMVSDYCDVLLRIECLADSVLAAGSTS